MEARHPPQFTAQAYAAMQVIHEALTRLDRQESLRSQSQNQALATMPLPELRRALNTILLQGTYDTPWVRSASRRKEK